MLTWIIGLLIFSFMNGYIYKRIAKGLGLSSSQRYTLIFFLVIMGSLYFVGSLIRSLFSLEVYSIHYVGGLWLFRILILFILIFLETGMSMVFPSKTRWWVIGTVALFAVSVLQAILSFPYGSKIPGDINILSIITQIGIFFLVVFIIYKIIVETLKLPLKKRGSLIILFTIGAILNLFLNLGIGLLSFMFGIYAVVYARVTAGLHLSKKIKKMLLALFGMGFVFSLPQMTFWGNGLGVPFLYYIGGIWFGLLAMAFTLFILESGISIFWKSHFRLRVIIVLILLATASGYGVFNGTRGPEVKNLTIPIKKLPENMSGFTIVQLADLHLGDIFSTGWLQKTVEKTNQLKPDLVVITGDLIDHGIKDYDTYTPILGQLKSTFGIIAVTGNHEYYNNRLKPFLEMAKKSGIRVLRNEWLIIGDGMGEIQIAGINDPTAGAFEDSRPDIKIATKDVDPQKPLILLSHQPGFFPEAVSQGVDLQLSAHTHAGQIPPMDLITYLVYSYPYGLYREGDSYIHTTCGTGLWGVPMRLFSRNEITRITLVK